MKTILKNVIKIKEKNYENKKSKKTELGNENGY